MAVRERAKMQMRKKSSTGKKPARTTLASVKWEMQQPRLTESVRNEYEKDQFAAALSKRRR
jgi:hypothetical protein